MITDNPAPVPTQAACRDRIIRLEEEYGVSLAMWVSLGGDDPNAAYFVVHVTGSGQLFDRMPARLASPSARLITAFPDPFASALWHCLDLLEHSLYRWRSRPDR